MKMIVDNQIVKLIVSNPASILNESSLFNVDDQIIFRWPSFLEFLELGTILSNLPSFDQDQPLFNACVSTLCANEEPEVVFYLYDRLFAEILKQISALPQINSTYLLHALNKQRHRISHPKVKAMLSQTLDTYEMSLTDNPAYAMHDLILYLAWDRMCVYMARLFDYQSIDPKFIKGITILRECLIESYQHITKEGRTTPGIYRMFESFLFYEMREENLQKHTAAEWATLSQSFQGLDGDNELVDVFYVDDAVFSEKDPKTEEENSECYPTLDSRKRVDSRLALAHFMMNKLKLNVIGWDYILHQKKIV